MHYHESGISCIIVDAGTWNVDITGIISNAVCTIIHYTSVIFIAFAIIDCWLSADFPTTCVNNIAIADIAVKAIARNATFISIITGTVAFIFSLAIAMIISDAVTILGAVILNVIAVIVETNTKTVDVTAIILSVISIIFSAAYIIFRVIVCNINATGINADANSIIVNAIVIASNWEAVISCISSVIAWIWWGRFPNVWQIWCFNMHL